MTEDILTIGVDLGGTKVKTALVDFKGKIIAEQTYPTQPEKGPENIINDILVCIETCLNQADRKKAHALGIGVAGQVDLKGVVQYAPNLNWHNIDLKANLEQQLDNHPQIQLYHHQLRHKFFSIYLLLLLTLLDPCL